ncbi:MAG: hypothetical protein JWL81_2363, partial [Verrucomicrobiales bacterium]|nr:hypothetical protein [Verrucomicrobiales bacterium]
GDCPELGGWDLTKSCEMECVNSNTWFVELPFDASAGCAVGYKFVIFHGGSLESPVRECRVVRRRLVTPAGQAKWRDHWEA